MNKVTLLFSLMILPGAMHAQVAVSYFPFQSIVSLSTDPGKLIWADYKLETNTFANNVTMELGPKINFIRRGQANYYTGIGFSFNLAYAGSDLPLVNGYFIDFGVRIIPLKSLENLQLIFELSPYVNRDFKGGNLRSRLGVGWNFIHRRKAK